MEFVDIGVGNFTLPSDKDRVRSKLIRIVIFFWLWDFFPSFFLGFILSVSSSAYLLLILQMKGKKGT